MIKSLLKKYPKYKWFIAFSDLFVFLSSYLISTNLAIFNRIPASQPNVIFVYSLFTIFVLFAMQYNGLYKRRVLFTYINQAVQLSKVFLYSSIFFILFLYFFRPLGIFIESRMVFAGLTVIPFVLLWLVRTQIIIRIFQSELLGNMVRENVLIYGTGEKAKMIAASLENSGKMHTNIVGFIDDSSSQGAKIFNNYEVVGTSEEIDQISQKHSITAIYLAFDSGTIENLFSSIKTCSSVTQYLYVSSEILDILPDDIREDNILGSSLIRTCIHKQDFYSVYVKRFTDILLSSIALLIFSPLLVIIALLIKLTSSGPVLFKQIRVGIHGNKFGMYKFRSMVLDTKGEDIRKKQMVEFISGKHNPQDEKIVNASRITRIGSFIRKYSIDELPQLWNVIRGEMSLIGPRPSMLYEAEHYSNWHFIRLEERPGCTGLWQVSNRYSRSYDDSVILDIFYVQNISLWLDLQIMLKTIPAVLFGGRD
jgi:exopolysaccharide biosynthesis polyprenyl glycosylphosphotransferase